MDNVRRIRPEGLRGDESEPGLSPGLGRLVADRRSPIWAQVYTLLRNRIAELRLLPGQNLSEKEISDVLGVSRTPVREAFIRLSEEGLVDIYPQYGTFVAPVRIPALMDAQFIRDSLECSIVKELAKRPDATLIAKAEILIAEQLRAVEAGDHSAFYQADEHMHEAFSVACGREGIWRFVQNAKVHVDRVRRLMLTRDLRFRSLVDEHAAILAAIAAGSPSTAAQAMHEHLEGVLHNLPEARMRHPDFFEADEAARRPVRHDRGR